MARPPIKHSALDLTIKGSIGSFFVSGNEETSTRVQFLQTHVTLTAEGGHSEKLLQMLKPVREVFPVRELDFEQIMQRDIDDARVSTDLIPYLLGKSRYGLVKFFPPIIVVVLPKGKNNQPADYYPSVTEEDRVIDTETYRCTRSGNTGQEVFEFRQWITNGELQDHDAAELRLNTINSRLVIVDGQHRAMALIGLYRNLTSWPEGTLAYKPFYERWTRSIIDGFDLSQVKVPVVFCAFPELDHNGAKLKVHEACRAVFLALNKNAKMVTRARNFLLDDTDVISAFMRQLLTDIKSLDERADQSIRIWNVELDAANDKNQLYSPVAITGVTHLYHIIETLMLGDPPSNHLRISGVKLGKRTDLFPCITRVRADEDLPSSKIDSRRDNCDPETLDILTRNFRRWYGAYIIRLLSDFGPYEQSNRASIDLYASLKNSSADAAATCHAMLFDGQGTDRVFEKYKTKLEQEASNQRTVKGKIDPYLQAVIKNFEDRSEDLRDRKDEFRKNRLDLLLKIVPKKYRSSDAIRSSIEDIFLDTLITSAFQHALVITFFDVINRINQIRGKNSEQLLDDQSINALFDGYLKSLNQFFLPSSDQGIKRLLGVMIGDIRESDGDPSSDSAYEVVPTSTCLRRILIPTQLDPKEWPKFRVMLVELWQPADGEASAVLQEIRAGLRSAVMTSYLKRRITAYAHDNAIPESKVSSQDRDDVRKRCAESLAAGLKLLGAKVSEKDFLQQKEPIAEDPDDEESSEQSDEDY